MKLYTPEHYADPTGALAVARAMGAPRFNADRQWPVVYICAPGETRRYCRFAVGSGYLPVAPAIWFPQFMDLGDPTQRRIEEAFRKIMIGKCRQMWIFGDRVTDEMAMEMKKARKRGMLMRRFTTEGEEVWD